MAKRQHQRKKQPAQEQQQPYDNLLKSLFEGQEKEMLDIEVIRPLLRMDRVYKILFEGEAHILHLEFETSSDTMMAARLLDYHVHLYRKYDLPVISVIVYPFRTTMAISPLEEKSQNRKILVFHFQTLPLWVLSAEKYVQEHAVAMYAFLPAMEGATAQLLNRAIDQMIQYYRHDEARLVRELIWLGIVLRRAEMVSLEDQRAIEERLTMYDDLFENDPKMKRLRAEWEARGKMEGEIEGEVKTLRKVIVKAVKKRFPSLTKLAQQRVKNLTTLDELDALFDQIIVTADEEATRELLTALVV